jgi:hypothetical protein
MHKHRHFSIALRAFGQKSRADAAVEVAASLGLILDDSHREVHGFADCFLRRGNGIQPRLKLA